MFELERIVCATDLSETSEAAFCHSLRIALDGKLALTMVHAEGDHRPDVWHAFPGVRARLAQWGVLDADADTDALDHLGLRPARLRALTASTSGLAHRIASGQPDLLVVGTEQRKGPSRLLSPSTAEELAREAHVPTLFVPTQARCFVDASTGLLSLKRVLAPIAHSPEPSWTLQFGQRLASTLGLGGLSYRTLHIGTNDNVPVVDLMADDASWDHRTLGGSVVDTVLEEAERFEADLIVMATKGHDSLRDRLFGSTVERVLRSAPVPVLVVPQR